MGPLDDLPSFPLSLFPSILFPIIPSIYLPPFVTFRDANSRRASVPVVHVRDVADWRLIVRESSWISARRKHVG
jgi:hypothetical protein